MSNKIKVSIIIPVFNTQNELPQCLESVISQTMNDIEIIVVDDGNESKPQVKDVIKKNFKKDKRIKIARHSINEGLIEARRTGILESHGEYVFFVDTDDKLNRNNALETMYEAAVRENADIVQCCAELDIVKNATGGAKYYEKAVNPQQGLLTGNEIFKNCYLDEEHTWNIWGKLLKRSTCIKAFDFIPETYSVMFEDFLLYFFISRNAEKYIGIPDKLYCYRVGCGMSTSDKITSLAKWKNYCSSASVFTIIFLYNRNYPLEEEVYKKIVSIAQTAIVRSVTRLETAVASEIKNEAREMLCDAWGRDVIEKAEHFYHNHFDE